jgi:hypothetical protein
VSVRHAVSGDISERLDDVATAAMLRRVEQAAQNTATTGKENAVLWPGAHLRVLPTGTGEWHLQTAVEQSDSWPWIASRLIQKAKQAQAAGGGWLGVDLLDGTWQFTPWARAGLRAQIDEMARQVRSVHADLSGISGVILSSGAAVAQGQFYSESARSNGNNFGLRHVLPAVRVRETMIVPLSAEGIDLARFWVDCYDAEGLWLDWALGLCGLPSLCDIFPAPMPDEAGC